MIIPLIRLKAEEALDHRVPMPPHRYLKGYAELKWQKKDKLYRFGQVFNLALGRHASMETVDDFGNTLFRFVLEKRGLVLGEKKKNKVKKVLSLPLKEDELISYLMYQLPQDQSQITYQRDKLGNILKIEKRAKRKKDRYIVEFKKLKDYKGRLFPSRMIIKSHKTSLTINWKDVELY